MSAVGLVEASLGEEVMSGKFEVAELAAAKADTTQATSRNFDIVESTSSRTIETYKKKSRQ